MFPDRARVELIQDCESLTCATTPTAASSSSSAPPSRFTNVSTLARRLTCASDVERYENSGGFS